jgi:hypothetical protein
MVQLLITLEPPKLEYKFAGEGCPNVYRFAEVAEALSAGVPGNLSPKLA